MTKATLQVRFPDDLLHRIDAFRRDQVIPPTMSDTIRFLVEKGLLSINGEDAPSIKGTDRHNQVKNTITA